MRFAADMFRGLAYLHAEGIIHRDVRQRANASARIPASIYRDTQQRISRQETIVHVNLLVHLSTPSICTFRQHKLL